MQLVLITPGISIPGVLTKKPPRIGWLRFDEKS